MKENVKCIHVDDDLHKKLKIQAARNGETIRDLVDRTLRKEVKENGRKDRKK